MSSLAFGAAQQLSIVLSLEEVLVVLRALAATTIAGLDDDGWAALSEAHRDLALRVAQGALEARGYAQLQPDGEVLMQRAVLTAVGVCAYAQRSAFVDHWAAPGVVPDRTFIHRHGDDVVVHTRQRRLSRFAVLTAGEDLADYLTLSYGWASAPAGPTVEVRMSVDQFSQASEAVAAGSQAAAVELLARTGSSTGAVGAFVHTLASQPRVRIVQGLTPPAASDSFTILSADGSSWLVAPASLASAERADPRDLRAQPASRDGLRGLLQRII